MQGVFPTVHCVSCALGLAAYEIRGEQLFPTAHNTRDTHGVPAYDLRGRSLFPSVHNQRNSYGVPAYDIRGKVGSQLNPDSVEKIARVYADWLPTKGTVAVGHDMRPDSATLADAFMNGLQKQGYDVWDIGLVTSDMIYFAVGKWDLAGGAVITASGAT